MPHHRAAWSGATSPACRVHGTPPGDADGNATCTRAAEDVGPYHAPPPHHLVGRDVPGAPRQRNAPRGRQRERHVYAGRRGRRPLPCPTTASPGRARRPRRAAPTERPPGRRREHPVYAGRRGRRPLPCPTTASPGRARRPRRAAPTERPRGRQRERHGDAGRRGRRPLPCPTTASPGRARRPRRAAPTERPLGTPTGTPRGRGPPRTSAPTTRPCRPRLTPPCASARCRARRRPAPPRRIRPWAARSRPAHTDSGCLR